MSSTATEPAPPIPPPDQPRDDLGPLPRIARPFVDWVARVRATVHTKLLAGSTVKVTGLPDPPPVASTV